jgi:hypothetical protein
MAAQVAGGQSGWVAESAPRLPVAAPTSRCATADDLRALAAEVGLAHRISAAVQVARGSIRLEVATDARRTGPPGPSLAAAATAGAALRLPERLLAGISDASRILDLAVDGSDGRFTAQVRPGAGSARRAACWGPAASRGLPLRPSRELVLPRAWSAMMDPFKLDASEQDAWQELRRRLADRQGVVIGDEAERGTVLHRVGGYPDERQGDMPLECELLDNGIDLAGEPPRTHPRAASTEREGRWRRWRLLLQLSADDRLGWSWGDRATETRVYLWIDLSDLRAHRFDRVRAVAR